ncbi:superoxide dismutase family protein [Granulosicoccus sp.]|nr:superoxide dismutase family protein [Granulosicoccus sp.]MDB4224728.1 superoxide dismutase family protein [Granulosicoccus sp.]
MKKNIRCLSTALAALVSWSVIASDKHVDATATTVIINNAGKEIGGATFEQGPRGILISLSVRDLPAGKHGMHIHSVGDCSQLEHFKSASGHIMPKDLPHGFFHPEGPHAGNLPNLIVTADGTAEVELYTNLLMLDKGEGAVLDTDGSALVIHTNPDDHFTQPIGGSGARIGCGVIESAQSY